MPKLFTSWHPSSHKLWKLGTRTTENQRWKNPYFWDCPDFAVQLSPCPSEFLNHLRGTDDRFLLAPAFAWPGIRKYDHPPRSYGQSQRWGRLEPGPCPMLSAAGSRLLSHLCATHSGLAGPHSLRSGSGGWAVTQAVFICSDHLRTLRWTNPASFRVRSRATLFIYSLIQHTRQARG